jgi:small-conductance mechanosensitive channel
LDLKPYLETVKQTVWPWFEKLQGWLASPLFYAQVIILLVAWLLARIVARQILARVALFRDEPVEGRLLKIRQIAFGLKSLIGPALLFVFLAIGSAVADAAVGASWLVRIGQSLALVYVLYAAINRFLTNPMVNTVARWVGLPVAAIYALGYFDALTTQLDGIAFQAGNIRISVLALAKAALFGGILFWLGRTSSSAGQKVIRDQKAVDVQTRELAAKALEIAVFAIVALLLLNILGLDLTALAVFGGAIGVGVGFGLQQIASNFISGIIILLERSLKIGDFIELEDGKAGTLREINMRSSILETFDGKDVMVPNDRFITTRFVNWTNKDPRQRYEVEFAVAYDTDLHKIPPLIAKAVSAHEQVLREPEEPDVELRGFGDNGVNFAVEFWVAGIDDGKNKFTSEVRFLIWDALKKAGVSMPFPQREVRILGDNLPTAKRSRA